MARVLVVDDHESVRQMLRQALETAGMVVCEAADGEKALDLFRRAPVDVVITDIVMPNKEGIETIFELRRLSSRLKIIAMSGRDTSEFLGMALKLGADHALHKPIEIRALVNLVRACLGPDSSVA